MFQVKQVNASRVAEAGSVQERGTQKGKQKKQQQMKKVQLSKSAILAFGCDFYPYAANPDTLSRKPLGTGNIDRRIQAEICFGGDGERVRTEQHQLT